MCIVGCTVYVTCWTVCICTLWVVQFMLHCVELSVYCELYSLCDIVFNCLYMYIMSCTVYVTLCWTVCILWAVQFMWRCVELSVYTNITEKCHKYAHNSVVLFWSCVNAIKCRQTKLMDQQFNGVWSNVFVPIFLRYFYVLYNKSRKRVYR